MEATEQDLIQELSRRKHLNFIKYNWNRLDPFIDGKHNHEICKRIDKAIEDYKQVKSSFIILTIPPRHGKTDIVSRYLPPHFLGMFPDCEVLVTSYNQEYANKISRDARTIFNGDQFKELYPDVRISKESSSIESWEVEKHEGGTKWAGAGGSITGHGFHLGIIDDFLKGRDDAESPIIRQKQWEWLQDVFLTRRAPISITIIMATRWHIDDLIGRIERANDPNSSDFVDNFPKFEIIKYPAINDKGEYLFPERFPKEFYESQRLNAYSWASLYMCEPFVRGGNIFSIEKIKCLDTCPKIVYNRAWDLASTEKELSGNDPDWTAGALVGVEKCKNEQGIKFEKVYVKNIVKCQSASPQRDALIIQTADIDGPSIKIGIECVAGYKDTANNIKAKLQGARTVQELTAEKDKRVRASVLEQIVESGNLYIESGEWNHAFLEELASFPDGRHDDMVDAVVHAYNMGRTAVDFSQLRMESGNRR